MLNTTWRTHKQQNTTTCALPLHISSRCTRAKKGFYLCFENASIQGKQNETHKFCMTSLIRRKLHLKCSNLFSDQYGGGGGGKGHYGKSVVYECGQFGMFRHGLVSEQRYHVDRHGQLTLKQLRLSVLNEMHINTHIQDLDYILHF